MNPLRLVSWLWGWWHERQRKIDIRTLWRACKEQTEDLESAKEVFAIHCLHDPAWLVLGDDEIKRRIDSLS